MHESFTHFTISNLLLKFVSRLDLALSSLKVSVRVVVGKRKPTLLIRKPYKTRRLKQSSSSRLAAPRSAVTQPREKLGAAAGLAPLAWAGAELSKADRIETEAGRRSNAVFSLTPQLSSASPPPPNLNRAPSPPAGAISLPWLPGKNRSLLARLRSR